MFRIEADETVTMGGITYCTIFGGDYEDCDLVEVYREGDEARLSIGAFQACFIRTGYNYGEEIPTGG